MPSQSSLQIIYEIRKHKTSFFFKFFFIYDMINSPNILKEKVKTRVWVLDLFFCKGHTGFYAE